MERINVNKEEKKQMELSVQELRDYIRHYYQIIK